MTEPLIRADIDLGAIAHNTREFSRIVPPHVKIMPAVKADGYGHGAIRVSNTALANGASALGVSRIEEGILLRKAGISVPILVFGYASPDASLDIIDHELTVTVSQADVARALSDKACHYGKKIGAHLKVDSGMGRIGMLTGKGHPGCPGHGQTALDEALVMARLPGLNLEGIYTHLASSDSRDKKDARDQLDIFTSFVGELERLGIEFQLRHAANSAAAIGLPESHLDMIRPGISFYGLPPSAQTDCSGIDLRPAMELKAKIISLKHVSKGFRVSYGSTYIADRETVIAVVPVGYADGFSRRFSSNGEMLVRGIRAPIVGRVCMDLTMIDVGHLPDLSLEEEVVIFGRQAGASLFVDELALRLGTINYEIVSNLNARVKRCYRA
ncbi:MAG: alanine racemase [Proteobacteria bacterium]|nr:alanine racemase [Pseudomonadota bacterium]